MLRHLALALAVFVTAGASVLAQQPRELGKVAWERDFESAKEKAAAAGKPILLLFQEVPG